MRGGRDSYGNFALTMPKSYRIRVAWFCLTCLTRLGCEIRLSAFCHCILAGESLACHFDRRRRQRTQSAPGARRRHRFPNLQAEVLTVVSPILVPSTARSRCFSGGARAGRQAVDSKRPVVDSSRMRNRTGGMFVL